MDSTGDEDDLRLVKTSPVLLADLESSLPRLLWKSPECVRAHSRIKRRSLLYIVNLIDQFQSEPQLLDARLRNIVPPLVKAYLDILGANPDTGETSTHQIDAQTAFCTLLYTLCKVRGPKIIAGFLNNEPRYLETILVAAERIRSAESSAWQVSYVLLLWLAHLLLTPFDLASISSSAEESNDPVDHQYPSTLAPVAQRALRLALHHLSTTLKTQDAAAALLVKLVTRPDMQKLGLADWLVSQLLTQINKSIAESPTSAYSGLGPMRVLAGIAASADLSHLVPSIYRAYMSFAETYEQDPNAALSNAVAKKLIVKSFRNVAILSLRLNPSDDRFLSFLQVTSVLEDVIDFLLRALGDRDSSVRYASAKAISQIISNLSPEMGHEVIQAILDTFKEDMPQQDQSLGFQTADPLKWHGLTLALAHTLFNRTASSEQLPDVINALSTALQFDQRTATGSSLGTNVRDAANFGIWSLSRRYTTVELQRVDPHALHPEVRVGSSIIQSLASQLILSACLDPAGNIRRGSSAALQELIGRHPDQVREGIALVQIVDYQAVGLRRRAMIDVAGLASTLHLQYQGALLKALFEWRGLGSSDVASREAAATSIASLNSLHANGKSLDAYQLTTLRIKVIPSSEVEVLHGLVLTAANIIDASLFNNQILLDATVFSEVQMTAKLINATENCTPRVLRSELLTAVAQFTSSICNVMSHSPPGKEASTWPAIDTLSQRLIARHEKNVLHLLPTLTVAIVEASRHDGVMVDCINGSMLRKKILTEGSRSTSQATGYAIVLGVLTPLLEHGLCGGQAKVNIDALAHLIDAPNVDWRIIGVRAIELSLAHSPHDVQIDVDIWVVIVNAVIRAMNDYTIDERGDIGSLVRLEAISCSSSILARCNSDSTMLDLLGSLGAGIMRLSLEKLDRVRLQAAKCRQQFGDLTIESIDVASVSELSYFQNALLPLQTSNALEAPTLALIEGLVSCAGVNTESVLQASRTALLDILSRFTSLQVFEFMTAYTAVLKSLLARDAANVHPALELLAFLLDTQIPQRVLDTSGFKWRTLLSWVQKAHHKSTDVPRILSAIHAYLGLADVAAIRRDVNQKLINMLKTNPYPRVRMAVAETLVIITAEMDLMTRDWSQPLATNQDVILKLQTNHIET